MPEGASEGQPKSSPLPDTVHQDQPEAHTGMGRRKFIKGALATGGVVTATGIARKAYGGEKPWYDTKELDQFNSANQAVEDFKRRTSELRVDLSVAVSKGENSNIPLPEGFNGNLERLRTEYNRIQAINDPVSEPLHRKILDDQLILYQQTFDHASKEMAFQKEHVKVFDKRKQVLKSLDEIRKKKETTMLSGKEWDEYDKLIVEDNNLHKQIQTIREASKKPKNEDRPTDQQKQTDQSTNGKLGEIKEKIKNIEDAARKLNTPFYKPEQK